MPRYVKTGGSWVQVSDVDIKTGGVWGASADTYVKVNGSWVSVQGGGGGASKYSTLIDDYEDNSLSEYVVDSSSPTVATGSSIEGTYWVDAASGGTNTIRSSSGLNAYPSKGDTFSGHHWHDSTGQFSQMIYGMQDANNYYLATLNSNANLIKVQKQTSGSFSDVTSGTSLSVSATTVYEVEVEWTVADEHTITAYDASGNELATDGPATDSDHGNGGFGWRISGMTHADWAGIK